MIEAQSLTKYYGGTPAVQDISFSVAEGETVGFLGANGAGKSTTMRMLCGFLRPTSGVARIGGFDLEKNPVQARQMLGYLPESTPLYHDMRVKEFLHYRSKIKNFSRKKRLAAVKSVLSRCQIEHVSNTIIGHLSKGYRQRVGLADCLLGMPKLLILDEPTVGLDPNQVIDTRRLIREIGRARTVFLSTHILHEVELICRRVIIIDNGRIVAEGNTEELCRKHAGPRQIHLEIMTDEDAMPLIKKLPGVQSVHDRGHSGDDTRQIIVKTDSGADPRKEIASMLSEKGWLLAGMRLEPVRLEDIFHRLTKGKENTREEQHV